MNRRSISGLEPETSVTDLSPHHRVKGPLWHSLGMTFHVRTPCDS